MAGEGDMKAHVATYDRITWLIRWGAVSCFVIAGFVIWLIK